MFTGVVKRWDLVTSVGEDKVYVLRTRTSPTLPLVEGHQYRKGVYVQELSTPVYLKMYSVSLDSFYQGLENARDVQEQVMLSSMIWSYLINCVQRLKQKISEYMHCWSNRGTSGYESCWTKDHSGYQCGSVKVNLSYGKRSDGYIE